MQKLLQDKEHFLDRSYRESNSFIDVVEKQLTTFMVDFRNQLAEWEKNKEEEKQTENWGKMMKVYLSKKLKK